MKRPEWNEEKFVNDIKKLIERSGERSSLLYALYLCQEMLRYVRYLLLTTLPHHRTRTKLQAPSILKQGGIKDQNVLEELQTAISTTTVYSGRYGTAQERLMTVLHREELSPGTSFRQFVQRSMGSSGDSGEGGQRIVNFVVARSGSKETEELLGLLAMWSPREHPASTIRASLLAGLCCCTELSTNLQHRMC